MVVEVAEVCLEINKRFELQQKWELSGWQKTTEPTEEHEKMEEGATIAKVAAMR